MKHTIDPRMNDTLVRLSNVPYMIACGIHSGFPPCCVKFYITSFTWMNDIDRRAYVDKINTVRGVHWGYVPCHMCMKSCNVVKVLPCPTGSNCFYVDEHPDNVPLPQTKETDRPIAHLLRSSVRDVEAGLVLIRGGGASNASVAAMMTDNINRMIDVIDRAAE